MKFKLNETLNESVLNTFEFLVVDKNDRSFKDTVQAYSYKQAKYLANKNNKGCYIRDLKQITDNKEKSESLIEALIDGKDFEVGDKVRVLTFKKAEYALPISKITKDSLILYDKQFDLTKEINFDEIDKIKKIPDSEDLNTDIYFDDEEKEFWRTHIISKKGIVDRHSIGYPYLDEKPKNNTFKVDLDFFESLDHEYLIEKKKKKDPTKAVMSWHQAFTGFNRDPEKAMEIFNHNMQYNDSFDGEISSPSDSSAGESTGGDSAGL